MNILDERTHIHRPTVRNPIIRFLYWASKTDVRHSALCSYWARATQCALGFFVLFTTTLAFGGMYYLLLSQNVPRTLVPWMAMGWACFVGLLDREIVGALDRVSAIVRPLLAILI